MNAREIYNAIQTGKREDAQQALFQLLAVVQELSTATLEIAHSVKQLIGYDPLGQRSRQWLSEFLDMRTTGESTSIPAVSRVCNTCGLTEQGRHDCTLILLGRARWLILHYAHSFAEADKKEALPLVEQIAGLLATKET